MWATEPVTFFAWSTWSATSLTVAPTLPSLTKKSPAMKGALMLIMTTPSLPFFRLSSTSSGTFRGWLQTARVFECEKMTGASLTSMALRIVSSCTCAMSTAMPTRFISRTTSQPKGERPPAFACSTYLLSSSSAASAQPGPPLCVNVLRNAASAAGGAARAGFRARDAARHPRKNKRRGSRTCNARRAGGTCAASRAIR